VTPVSPAVERLEPRADVMHLAPAFGIYVHIPYCISRCPYCDFNTYVGIEDTAPEYVDALLREARSWAERAGAREAGAIFAGGGTPSLLDPTLMRKMLDGLRATFHVSGDAEITIEANPETVDIEWLSGFRDAGVNRISFGAQSFRTEVLATLGRAHTAERTEAAVREARAAGFDNLNLDLIYGTPGESFDDWRLSLEKAIALDPEHLSAYALTIEEGTAFGADVAAGRMPSPDDDDMAAKYELALDMLADAGYEHYEISNWAKPGRESRHNLTYWRDEPYLGFGSGAASSFDGRRWKNHPDPAVYIESAALGAPRLIEDEQTDTPTRIADYVGLRLRLREGLDPRDLVDRFGLTPEALFGQELGYLRESGHIELRDGRLRIPSDAIIVTNEILARLLSDAEFEGLSRVAG
jgi:oxygen-independent coproporphyrinogen-3 oxidase